MSFKEGVDYRIVDSEVFEQIHPANTTQTLVRIVIYNKIHHEDYRGTLYIEILKTKSIDEIDNIVKQIRDFHYLDAESFRVDILIKKH
jgi:hypothetical protein